MRLTTWLLWKASELIGRFSPPNRQRYRDELSYQRWQSDNAVNSYGRSDFVGAVFRRRAILDLGCGDGGKTAFLSGFHPAKIVGVDLDVSKLRAATQFASILEAPCRPWCVGGDVEKLPFQGDSFDLCISEDGFEHFPGPARCLREANRILKTGGRVLAHFPSYYNSGGPHLYNWIRLPWAHLVFSDRTLIEAARFAAKQMPEEQDHFRESPNEWVEREIFQFRYFVNKITIGKFLRMLQNSPGWRLLRLHLTSGRRLFLPFVHAPIVREMFASVTFVLEKQPGSRVSRRDIRNMTTYGHVHSMEEVLETTFRDWAPAA